MAQFVTHIQPTLMEASHHHMPHHHKECHKDKCKDYHKDSMSHHKMHHDDAESHMKDAQKHQGHPRDFPVLPKDHPYGAHHDECDQVHKPDHGHHSKGHHNGQQLRESRSHSEDSGLYIDSHGIPHAYQLHFIDAQGIYRDSEGHALDVECQQHKEVHHKKEKNGHHKEKDGQHKEKDHKDKDMHRKGSTDLQPREGDDKSQHSHHYEKDGVSRPAPPQFIDLHPINLENKGVLVALKFFGLGSYQEITGTNSYTGVSQSSVSRAIREVCDALTRPHIFEQWVHFPRNIRELENQRRRFYEKYEFPGVIGVIDCTHVAIVSPKRNDDIYPEHIYVNRKNYHSINVQLICDENLKIMNVNARFPGSCHDSHIWRQSAVSETMEQIYRQNNNNIFYLIGDSGYPLRPWLLTPLQDVEPGTPEERFNNQFKSIRSIIERCNGVLKNRFRCLIKHRVLHYTPEVASKIINTCIILHNMCVQHNVPEPDEDMLNADWGMNVIDNNQLVEAQANIARVNPDLAAARVLQQRIIRQHFNN